MEPNQTTETVPVAPALPVVPVAPKVMDLFKQGWQFTKQNKDFTVWYIVISTILAIITSPYILELFLSEQNILIVFGIGTLVFGIASGLIAWGLMRAVLRPAEALTVASAFQWSLKNFWLLLWTAIISTLCILLGFILFIVPGIIMSGYWYFTFYALADEKGAGLKAMKYSYSIVKKRWLQTFGKLFFLGLVSFAVAIVFYIGVAIIAAFAGDQLDNVNAVGDILIQGIVGATLTIITIHAMGQYYRFLEATKV